jgi:hypothetical protein
MSEINGKTYTHITWDWRSRPEYENLCEALEPFGIIVIVSPMEDGSDQYGYLFSREKLSDEELQTIDNEYWEQ